MIPNMSPDRFRSIAISSVKLACSGGVSIAHAIRIMMKHEKTRIPFEDPQIQHVLSRIHALSPFSAKEMEKCFRIEMKNNA